MGRSKEDGRRRKPWELRRELGKHPRDQSSLEKRVRAKHPTLAPASGVAGSGTYNPVQPSQQSGTSPNTYAFAAEDSARRAGAAPAGSAGGGITSHHSSIWKGLGYTLAGLALLASIGVASVYALGSRGGGPGPVPFLTPTATATATATPAPTATATPYIPPTPTISRIDLNVINEIKALKDIDPELANVVVGAFGAGNYSQNDYYAISAIETAAGALNALKLSGLTNDLKLVAEKKSFVVNKLSLTDGRTIDLVVLSNDTSRASFYNEAIPTLLQKTEAFNGQTFAGEFIVIYSPVGQAGVNTTNSTKSFMLLGYYPETPDRVVIRRYETTTQKKAAEEIAAHELDHLLSKGNKPTWLEEGMAEFNAYHSVRTDSDLPTMSGNFAGYRANVEQNVRGIFDGTVPSISKYDGILTGLSDAPRVTGLGNLLLEDILSQIGPSGMSGVVKDINAVPKNQFIDKKKFYDIVLSHTQDVLKPQMLDFLQMRYEGGTNNTP